MSDELTEPRWQVTEAVQAAMLLEEARQMVRRGQYEHAVGLAEELLDHSPADVEALLLVADAAPRYGHGEVGLLAARAAARQGADIGALEAAALLGSSDVHGALAAADACIAKKADDARAWAVRGQALEVLERDAEADAALAEAHRLRPSAYAQPLPIATSEWEALLMAALSKLAPHDRDEVKTWEISWQKTPSLELLRSSQPPIPPTTLAIVSEGSEGPPRLELYTRNLSRGCTSIDEVGERVHTALLDELALWTG